MSEGNLIDWVIELAHRHYERTGRPFKKLTVPAETFFQLQAECSGKMKPIRAELDAKRLPTGRIEPEPKGPPTLITIMLARGPVEVWRE
jgi:hypothetical protein